MQKSGLGVINRGQDDDEEEEAVPPSSGAPIVASSVTAVVPRTVHSEEVSRSNSGPENRVRTKAVSDRSSSVSRKERTSLRKRKRGRKHEMKQVH